MRKKLFAIEIIVILLLTLVSYNIMGFEEENCNQITINYSFEMPIIEKADFKEEFFDRVIIKDCALTDNADEPNLPSKGAYILIPFGRKVTEIIITKSEKVTLGEGFKIEPSMKTVLLSEMALNPVTFNDEAIYSSTDPYPGKVFEKINTYNFRGYGILVLRLYPIHYVPLTGELYFYRDFAVTIKTEKDTSSNQLYRGFEKDKQNIIKKVDNPNVANSYPVRTIESQSDDEYDLLIITSDYLKNSFNLLKDAHDNNGVRTIIKTLSEIDSRNPEDIRDYIREMYTNWGIDYVLIGGDNNAIPARKLWVQTRPGQPPNTKIPSDLYYSCLDGIFNYDGDNRWGEPTDGTGGCDVDLMAEVYVGRASVSNNREVKNFIKKTTSYISINPEDDYLKKVLMVGQYKGKCEDAEWGGNYLDELIDECYDSNYSTIGIPSNEYEIKTLYDRDWEENNWLNPYGVFGGWPKYQLIKSVNKNSPHFINHNGHGLENHALNLWNLEVFRMKNTKYFFLYSTTCLAGHFDGIRDCFAEYITVKTDHGAFAAIMNAREGRSSFNTTDCASQRFHREFWDAVFGENITTISKANQDSKEDNIWRIDESGMRWSYYQLNLFGDPTIEFKR